MRMLTGLLLGLSVALTGSSSAAQQDAPFRVEYYYKVKWGHFNEFLELYKRNHYPILVKQQEMGRILEMSASSPAYHAGEETRWDFRFTIVWKNAAIAHDDFDGSAIIRELYPDLEEFEREEQRRFELLEAHLDVPVARYNLEEWSNGG